MARWSELEAEVPDLCAQARRAFDAHRHKTLATLRRDGSPRISGIEMFFAEGDAWIGSMWKAVKALDLRRDPRFAIHSGSDDPPDWPGDAKFSGTAEEIRSQQVLDRVMAAAHEDVAEHDFQIEETHLFRLEIGELVHTGLNEAGDKLVVRSWVEGRGLRTLER